MLKADETMPMKALDEKPESNGFLNLILEAFYRLINRDFNTGYVQLDFINVVTYHNLYNLELIVDLEEFNDYLSTCCHTYNNYVSNTIERDRKAAEQKAKMK